MLTTTATPGSAEELRRFAALQQRLPGMFDRVFACPQTPRTVVVVPSFTLGWNGPSANTFEQYTPYALRGL